MLIRVEGAITSLGYCEIPDSREASHTQRVAGEITLPRDCATQT
jgi:hypothetical protein